MQFGSTRNAVACVGNMLTGVLRGKEGRDYWSLAPAKENHIYRSSLSPRVVFTSSPLTFWTTMSEGHHMP